jgi:hypothetical protein
MSRIPIPEWVQLAEHAKSAKSFQEKVALVGDSPSKYAAALIALHYEAVDTIGRLADLVERGSNTLLIDKAAGSIQTWNDAVRHASGLVRKV